MLYGSLSDLYRRMKFHPLARFDLEKDIMFLIVPLPILAADIPAVARMLLCALFGHQSCGIFGEPKLFEH